MTRTTVDIDGPVLEDLKRLQKEEAPAFHWISRPMKARVDLADKEAARAAADAGLVPPAPKTRP